MQGEHYSPRPLPEPLQALASLALDLRWTWHHGADELWRTVDPELWEATANPWLILESVSEQRLTDLADDRQFLQLLQRQLVARDQHLQTEDWFPSRHGEFVEQIAYFSMEFGVSEALPIYSGGLGVLAGDFLKTACDLNVPVVGVGLLYHQGYFRQALDVHGEQLEFYPFNDPTMLPVTPLRGDSGEWIRVIIELPGRSLRLRTWHVQVGRRSLLLLDSNDPLNNPSDRGITSELYGGGSELRLQQEIILGIGGWRLLEKLGIDCPVCHLNEGHAAFAVLERARRFMRRTGQPFDAALRATRAGNLFTTHTPVEAGFDRFVPEMVALYFNDYAAELNITVDSLLALGRADPADAGEPFNMAYLAMHGSGAINGVSRLHGGVSQTILQPLFPRWPRHEVPVGYVTNGVHVPSWDSAVADAVWTRACGKDRWRGALETTESGLRQVDDNALWRLRNESRRQLVAFLRKQLRRQHYGHDPAIRVDERNDLLDPDVLTLGFARRFAEYKRSNLLLHNPHRLVDLLTHRDRPVQLIIAGKAHPRDMTGKRLIRQWQNFMAMPGVRGRVIFVEDYDLAVAGQLVQGVDVWLNTPRRPWEASGTSGMKVLVNGGINLSELDGWWAEAFNPEVGWALGDAREHADVAAWDVAEAEQLYRILENEVIPSFYQRDQTGLPVEWIARMRESMAQLTAQFSSNRMLREYVETYYIPMSDSYRRRDADTAVDLEVWHRQLAQHWRQIHFGNVNSTQGEAGYHFDVQVYLDDLPAEAVQVELYADPVNGRAWVRQPLQRDKLLAGTANAFVYRGTVPADRPAEDYTPRVVPYHDKATVPLEANFILWYR